MGVDILFATKLRVADVWHLAKAEGTYQAKGHPSCSGPYTCYGVPVWPDCPTMGHPPSHRVPTPSTVQGKCWERGVPADTWGRKDLLWGWDKAKLKKEEAFKCPSPAAPRQTNLAPCIPPPQ